MQQMAPHPMAMLLPRPIIERTPEIIGLIPGDGDPMPVINARAALYWELGAAGCHRRGQHALLVARRRRLDEEERRWISELSPAMRQKWLNRCAYDAHHLTRKHSQACRAHDFALAARVRRDIETARRVARLIGSPL